MIETLRYHQLTRQFEAPPFVKESEIPGDEELGRLQASRFADPETRRLPVHTKAATWLSAAKFWSDALYDPTVRQDVSERLKKAAGFWDIREDVEKILMSVAGMAKQAQEAQAFALETEAPNGEAIRRFPLLGPESTVKSAQALYDERYHLPLGWKRQASQRILKAAQEHQVEGQIPAEAYDYAEQAAGLGVSSLSKLAQALEERYNILHTPGRTHDEEAAGTMQKFARATENETETSLALCDKVAQVLDRTDREHNLFRLYSKGLSLPEQACHSVLRKHAQARFNQYVTLHGGRMYPKKAFEELGDRPFRPMIDVHRQVTDLKGQLDMDKVAQVVPNLEPAQAAVIQTVLTAQGYEPEQLPGSFRELLSA